VFASIMEKKESKGRQLRKINSGVWRRVGVGDPLTWQAIASKISSHPTWTQREIAKSLCVSPALVNKVKGRLAGGETAPRKHGTGEKRRFPEANVQVMVELLRVEEPGHTYTMRAVQHVLREDLGEIWSLSTLNRRLGREYSRQKAVFEDPRKWTKANCQLIEGFLCWRLEHPVAQHYQVKVRLFPINIK
jgi:transposase